MKWDLKKKNKYRGKGVKPKGLFKLLIISDVHGWLADLKCLRVVNKILQKNKFQEVLILGDLVDMPYISRHTKKLFEDGILNGYSEIEEIRYTKEQILNPLRASTDANIRVMLGNHEERITKPQNNTQAQVARLAALFKAYNTSEYDTMLGLTESEGYIYTPTPFYTYFDMFDVTHGLSLSKNAPEKNITEYMSSGASGHTHRLNAHYKTNNKNPYVWLETGCMRLRHEVEFIPTGKVADWQNGFVDVSFFEQDGVPYFFAKTHIIIDGMCWYEGRLYNGNTI